MCASGQPAASSAQAKPIRIECHEKAAANASPYKAASSTRRSRCNMSYVKGSSWSSQKSGVERLSLGEQGCSSSMSLMAAAALLCGPSKGSMLGKGQCSSPNWSHFETQGPSNTQSPGRNALQSAAVGTAILVPSALEIDRQDRVR